MKKAREKFIELDQAFDVIAAELNGRPVLEESKFEACRETSDTLVRKTLVTMYPNL